MRLDILGPPLVGLQQLFFERVLGARPARVLGPVQQAVRVQGVVNAPTTFGAEGKADLGTTLTNSCANLFLQLGGGAVFFGQMLANILSAGRHLRVQLEGLEVHFHLDLLA